MSYSTINGAAINDSSGAAQSMSLRPVHFGVPRMHLSVQAASLQPVWFGPGKVQNGVDVVAQAQSGSATGSAGGATS